MVEFGTTKFSDFWTEAQELMKLHYEEVVPYRNVLKLNLDTDSYLAAEVNGMLHIVTARDRKKLVGYVLLGISRNVHYKDVIMANDDAHYLHPDYRKGSTGSRLIAAAETLAKAFGAKFIVMRTKNSHNHGVLFKRRGYDLVDLTYMKQLGA